MKNKRQKIGGRRREAVFRRQETVFRMKNEKQKINL
jgi:hypothetical protein